MRQIIAFFGFLAIFTLAVHADSITLENGAIQFDTPAGFKPLSRKIIALKFPRARPPRFVVGNARATTTVAYDLKATKMLPDQIDGARSAITSMLPRMIPGLVWKVNKTIELSGKKWAILEMTSHAVDTDIYNIMLFTSYNGRMLIFNFNSTKEDFKTHEEALRKSIRSIKVK